MNKGGRLAALMLVSMVQMAAAQDGRLAAAPVKIGAIIPLTGGLTVRGQDIQRLLELLLPHLNRDPARRPLTVLFEDGKCGMGASATSAAVKLIEIERVNFLISGCSGETLQIGPLAQKHKIPLMAVLSNHQDISKIGDYVFRSFPMNQDFAVKLIEALRADAALPLAMISEENAFTLAFKDIIQTKLSESIVLASDYAYDTVDFRAILTKVRGSRAASLFANYASAFTCAALVNQARQLKVEIPIYGFYFLREAGFLSAAGQNAEGITVIDLPQPSAAPELYGEVLEAYLQKYKEGPSLELLTRLVFDTMVLFRQAVDQVGTEPAKIKDYFYTYQAPGAAGMVRFNDDGDRMGLEHTIKKIRAGQIVDVH